MVVSLVSYCSDGEHAMVMLVREMCTVCSGQDTFRLEKGNNILRTRSQQELLISCSFLSWLEKAYIL